MMSQQSGYSMASGVGPLEQWELQHYQTLAAIADPARQGFVNASSGAELLRRSGLPQPMLADIWNIADAGGQGFLSTDQLFVALRLVAHAQAGASPSLDLAQIRPQMLPEFEGVMRNRAASEISGPSIRSDPSDFRPVISADQASLAAQYASRRQTSPSPPRAFTSNRWAPSVREKRKYASLFLRTDLNADGYVEPLEARQLLERAGLDQASLGVIWEHADVDHDGRLSFAEFVAFVHLVTCVRRGATLPGLAEGIPPELLKFLSALGESPQELHGQRSRSSSRAPSTSRGRSPSQVRWTPTPRQKRKYASLFLRTDSNKDGYVESGEAKNLLERAGLDSSTLGVIWEHADADHDGRFSFPEFVALVHLVTCIRRGAKLPELTEGIPQDLWRFLSSIEETPEELDRQRSRSSSRTRSTSPLGTNSDDFWSSVAGPPATSRTSSKLHVDASQFNTSPASGFDAFADSFGPAPQSSSPQGLSSNFGFDTSPTSALGTAADPFSTSADPFGISADPFGTQGFPPAGESQSSQHGKKKKRHDKGETSNFDAVSSWGQEQFRDRDRGRDRRDRDRGRGEDPVDRLRRQRSEREAGQLEQARRRFEALITADRAVSRRVREEATELEKELRHVRDVQDQLGQQVQQKQQDIRRSEQERRQLAQRLEDAKQRLADLHEDRRAMNLEDISIMRDHEHFQEEMQFYKRMTAEEAEKLEECIRSNQFLDRVHRGLEVQTEQLEKQRKEFIQEVAQEEADLRKELRLNAEMLTDLQRMRREQHVEHHGRHEANLKEQRFRQMQASRSLGSSTAAAVKVTELEDPRERKHSWASHVSTPSDPRTAWVT